MNPEIRQISPIDLINNPDGLNHYFLLDVREIFEHDDFNIGGKCIPLGEIMQQIMEIPAETPVLVYCKKGIRSQIAIQRLQDKLGLVNLFNLEGGMDAWKKHTNG